MDLCNKLKLYSMTLPSVVVLIEAYRTNNNSNVTGLRHSPRCCTCLWGAARELSRMLSSIPAHNNGKAALSIPPLFSFLCGMWTSYGWYLGNCLRHIRFTIFTENGQSVLAFTQVRFQLAERGPPLPSLSVFSIWTEAVFSTLSSKSTTCYTVKEKEFLGY